MQSPALLVRSTAVEGLSKRKEPDVLAVAWSTYEACMDRKWVEVRETIVDVFSASPGPESDRWLRQIAKDPVPSVSRKARRQLADRGVGDLPAEAKEERAENPYWSLRFKTNPVVVLDTTHGVMEIECLADEAPIHVANFVGLVRAKKYDGLLWHRVVPAFVIQGGDPYGTGMGDAGWPVRAEINPARYERGALGMPRSFGFDTGGCQLFFTHLPTPHLDGQYTVFGRVVKGQEVIDLIERGDAIKSATVRE
jgi:cyclophilin family peptidyl-prolyl cis-trans isomerase